MRFILHFYFMLHNSKIYQKYLIILFPAVVTQKISFCFMICRFVCKTHILTEISNFPLKLKVNLSLSILWLDTWKTLQFKKDCIFLIALFFFAKKREWFYSSNIYLFKITNRNTKKTCGIFSKLTIKTPQ